MLKGFYYLYFALSRLCRASQDKSFGEFRVHVLLMLIEINLVFGLIYFLKRERIGDLDPTLYVIGMVLPLVAMNNNLFASGQKRSRYEQEFRKYPERKRRTADVATLLACIGALLLPFVVRWTS
jgi:hypothetical protein